MGRKVAWGALGVAGIAVKKVIPAMQSGASGATWSRSRRGTSNALAEQQALGIPKAYGFYEELLADREVEAVYNPLPNHLHVPWSIRAAEQGKHVLCEKPIGLNADEAERLLAVRDRTGVKIQEAFMVRSHPQWLAVRDLVRSGRIGPLRSIACHFSYFNDDPSNVRNVPDWGGAGLMDIGCYPITISRFLFAAEPRRVMGLVERGSVPLSGIWALGSAVRWSRHTTDAPSHRSRPAARRRLRQALRAGYNIDYARVQALIDPLRDEDDQDHQQNDAEHMLELPVVAGYRVVLKRRGAAGQVLRLAVAQRAQVPAHVAHISTE